MFCYNTDSGFMSKTLPMQIADILKTLWDDADST